MDYVVKPVGKNCAITGEELVPGTLCYSTLVDRKGELVRLDFSERGWAGPPAGTIARWRCRVPQPPEKKPTLPDPDTLLRFFEQLLEDAQPGTEKLQHIVALLLLQKRRLKIEGSREDEYDHRIEWLELVGSKGEGPFLVRNFQLDEQEVAALQGELNAQLARGWG